MTRFLDWNDRETVQQAAVTLRDWQRGRQALGVALVYGGVSAEDKLYLSKSPVEQLSVTALAGALTEIGADFKRLDPTEPTFIQELAGFDVALSNLHGPWGEDGRLQGLLDYLRVPYCGSGVGASAVAADKVMCKRVMEALGVPTPDWWAWAGGAVEHVGQPVMVKPAFGGSSVGMSLIRDEADLLVALAHAQADSHSQVLVEEYVPGLPVTVGLLELPGAVLVFPPLSTEVRGAAEFYDADTKLDAESQSAVNVRAADLTPEAQAGVISHAKTLWDGLGIRGSARVDYIVNDDGHVYALEVNTNPGMSKDSNFAVGAALCGFSHTDVVLAMLHQALDHPLYDAPLPAPVFSAAPAQREPAA
ncbi:D-alanine--D-alanine ligase family protein [Streptomyces luteireticuli]|uniref:D-alanine--D-alanine ligase n=1 Tax=Streptomyces luteireticuli TaxID=173858 RepID=A0ABN0Z6Y3_9ACTN